MRVPTVFRTSRRGTLPQTRNGKRACHLIEPQPCGPSQSTWVTLEGEQTIKFWQFSGFGFQPLNHNKQKCKMFPNNSHEWLLRRVNQLGLEQGLLGKKTFAQQTLAV